MNKLFQPTGKNRHAGIFNAMRVVLLVQEMFPELPDDMLLGDLAALLREKFECNRATAYRWANSAVEALHGSPYKFTERRQAIAKKRNVDALRVGRNRRKK